MSTQYQCLRIYEEGDKFVPKIENRALTDLHKPGNVLIRVHYSSLNYKDALSSSGHKGITREFPHTPGIDASGIIEETVSDKFKVGDKVIVTSYDLGMNTNGGFAEYISVPEEWVVKLPEGLNLKEAMLIGTAGFTAALALYKMEQSGQKPEMGKILVTGATGGVGTLAIALLKKAGYEVIASTGKESSHDILKSIGASEIISREEVNDDSKRPFLKTRWAGAIDTIGGNTLETILKSAGLNANIAVCGLVASPNFSTTVYPFIIKGNNLLGIESATTDMETRVKLWQNLSGNWKISLPEEIISEISLNELPSRIEQMLKSNILGRTIVKLK